MIVAILSVILFIGLLLTFLYFFPIVFVVGESMYPTYKDRELILAKSHFDAKDIKVGDVIVFKTPSIKDKILIKRVSSIHNEEFSDSKSFFVLGDNRDNSNDSRDFGWVDEECIIAVVLKPRENRYKIPLN